MKIHPYRKMPAVSKPYDPRYPLVADALITVLERAAPDAQIEHVGSTAVVNCGGKGIIDLMVVSPQATFESIRHAIDKLGFQKQTGPDPFPETRPMRTGAVVYDGREYQAHVHIIPADCEKPGELLYFRDILRRRPDLVAAHEQKKREILDSDITDSYDYCIMKGKWVEQFFGPKGR